MMPPDFAGSFDIDGQRVTIRTMRPEDQRIEEEFVKALSPTSRYYRFHGTLQKLSPSMLERFTNPNYPDEMALIATISDHGAERQIGVARYARTEVSDHAEVAIVVADEWQGKGIGSRMLKDLREFAKQAGFHHLEVNILKENRRMMDLARGLGFLDSLAESDFSAVQLGKDIPPYD